MHYPRKPCELHEIMVNALETPSLDYEKSMRMGHLENLKNLVKNQVFFDGSKCVRCYYSGYNDLFELLWDSIAHERFV